MIHHLVVLQSIKMLRNLLAFLDEAEQYAAKKEFDIAILLRARLAPDQYDLIRQVQIACDTVKLGVARLAGAEKDVPYHDDKEQTLAEVRTRIEQVIAYLGRFTPKDFEGATERVITQARWKGKTLTGEEFLIHHVIPNFYFHITTAYAILRHNGVALGKRVFTGDLPFRRPPGSDQP
jgi:hypothetical protein